MHSEMPSKVPVSALEHNHSNSPDRRRRDESDHEPKVVRDLFQLGVHALVAGIILYLPLIDFCWRLIIISFYFTYQYFIFLSGVLFDFPNAKRHLVKYMLKATCHCTILALLTSWFVSMTPIHVLVPTPMDLFTPYTIPSAHRATNIMYDSGSSAVVDILAIHGLGSNPDSAWTYKYDNGTRVNWLRDLLPTTEGFQGTRVVMVNHQTRWDSNVAEMGFHEHASELLEHIQSIHMANPERPMIFIAHSFGGLLLKKALLLAKSRARGVAAMTKGIIFLGVPHSGSNAAFFAACLSCMAFFRGSSSYLLELMAVNGPGLLEIESEFYDAYVIQYHSEDIQPYICDILERRPERIGKLVLGPIVSPRRSQPRHGRLLALDTDHRGLNKFQSHDDPNFEAFLRVLWQAYEHAMQNSIPPENRFPPPMTSIAEEPMPANDTITAQDLVAIATLGLPSAKIGTVTAAGLYGLEELTASWLAKDRNRYGNYFTSRVPALAIYGGLIHVPLRDALMWLLRVCFSHRMSLVSQVLQIVIIYLLIVPFLSTFYLITMALVSGARTHHHVRATIRVGFRPMIKVMGILLPANLFCGYLFLPKRVWVPVCNIMSFLVGTYTNTLTKKKRLLALRMAHFFEIESSKQHTHTPSSS
ncbi:hypothetical protein F4804DRAFT_305447 [Jackrogersella minutella]|nr:hypothetical protein F4804DRAFT_305447 [Jackrogersella minutella]